MTVKAKRNVAGAFGKNTLWKFVSAWRRACLYFGGNVVTRHCVSIYLPMKHFKWIMNTQRMCMCGQSFHQICTKNMEHNGCWTIIKQLQYSSELTQIEAMTVCTLIGTHSFQNQIDVHSFIKLTVKFIPKMCSNNNRSLITAQWMEVFATYFCCSTI